MWRNLICRRNSLSVNQTAQCLKRSSTSLSSFSPVSLNQTAPYCVSNMKSQEESDTSMPFEEVMAKQTDVSLSFVKHLFLREANKNVVVSPLSIQVLLGLVAAGSKGATLRQLLCFLKANSVDDLNLFASRLSNDVFAHRNPRGGVCFSFANGLWIDKSLILKPSYKQIVDSHYKAALTQVDFQNKAVPVTQQINSWVEKNTGGLIKELVQDGTLDESDRLVFVNALYFKGVWLEKFDSSITEDDKFHLLCGSSLKAPFMFGKKNEKYLINVCDGFKVLGLPYKRRFTMYIFLPGLNDGLPSLVEKIGSQSNFLELYCPKTLTQVGDLRIPKFKISYKVMASNLLKQLGLTLPFGGGELTEMADSVDSELPSVSNIFQKAFIEVDEEGTKASVATFSKVYMKARIPTTPPPPKLCFVANHPFLFLIKEDSTGAVLFVGQVLNPLAG